jgi:transcription antitermination factor NusG
MLQDDNSVRERRIYRLGEIVRIKTGAFGSFAGRIEGIN